MKTKGIIFLLSGIVVGILFTFVLPFLLVFSTITGEENGEMSFSGPGSHQITIESPGSYVLWNDWKTVRDGRTVVNPRELPSGFSAEVLDPNGQKLELYGGWTQSVSVGNRESSSISEFEAETPGIYTVVLSGVSQEQNFSVGKGLLEGFFRLFLLSGISVIVGIAGGITLFVIGIVKLARKPKQVLPPVPS